MMTDRSAQVLLLFRYTKNVWVKSTTEYFRVKSEKDTKILSLL